MEKIKKIVMEIGKYFKENYGANIFQKTVSMLVVICLIINIVNLPAFASEKRVKDNKEKNEQVMESGKTNTSEIGLVNAQEAMKSGMGEGVSRMNRIGNMSEKDVDSIIEIDEKNGVIKDKTKGNKVVAVYNSEKKQVLGYAGQADIVYYQALVNRKESLKKGVVAEKKWQKAEKEADKNVEKTEIKAEKTAEEIADMKGVVIGYKTGEQPTLPKPDTLGIPIEIPGFTPEEDNVILIKCPICSLPDPMLNTTVMNGQITKTYEGQTKIPDFTSEEDNVIVIKCPICSLPDPLLDTTVMKGTAETTQKQEKNIQTSAMEQNKEEVIKKLSQDTGVSKKEAEIGLEEALKDKTQGERENIIGLLKTFFDNGGDIANCAVEALGKILDMQSKGVLGLQTLLVEISTGLFVKNNEDLINSGKTQLMTSMSTMQQVMEQYGKKGEGYSTDIDTFVEKLGIGESAIVWVNNDHYITVTKIESMKYGIVDSNVKNGTSVEYSEEGLKTVLSGKEGVDINGKKVGVSYKAQEEEGKIKVLAVSEGLKQAKEERKVETISKKEMVKIKGANTDKNKEISIGNNGATITDTSTGEKKDIVFDKNLTEEELKAEKEFISKYGISAWEEHIRGEGLLKQETLYDKAGTKIYIATKVDYDSNSHTIALKYDFYQAYTDDIYFINSQNIKLLVQSYKKDAATGLLTEDVAMVYSVATNAREKEYEFENGIKVNMAISNVDRIVEKGEFVEKDEKDENGNTVKKEYQEYRAIDYSNGNNINNGIPTGLEYIKVNKNGQKEFVRYELANYTIDSEDSDEKDKDKKKDKKKNNNNNSEETNSDNDTDEDDTTKEYKKILEKTAQLKIKDYDSLYDGYKYVSDKYITGIISYSTQTQQYVRSCKIGDLNITARLEGVGSNWRYLKYLSKGAKVNLDSKGKDVNGKDIMYMANAELTADSPWEDIDKNMKVDGEVIICGYTKDDKGNIVYDPCYRVSGKYSDTQGFYGGDLGEYSDYFTSVKNGDETISIYNIKRTADGKYVSQENTEDKYASTYYITKEKSSLKVKKENGEIVDMGQEREREVMNGIKGGIVFEKNEKGDVILKDGDKILEDESGNIDLKGVSNKLAVLPNEDDIKDMENYYSEETETETHKTSGDVAVSVCSLGMVNRDTNTTTTTTKYAVWNENEGIIEYHTMTTKAENKQINVWFFKTEGKGHLTVEDNNRVLVDKHYSGSFSFTPIWDTSDKSLSGTFEQFADGKVDFNKAQMKYLNDAGIDIKNYTQGMEHMVDITINLPGIENGKVYQNIRTYKTDGSYIYENMQPVSVRVGSYYTLNGIYPPDTNTGNIYNARGTCSRIDYDYKNNGERVVIGHGSFVQNAFIGKGMCVSTIITNGTYYGAKAQLDENKEVKVDDKGKTIYETDENGNFIYTKQNWTGITNYSSNAEAVIGEWFNGLSKKDQEKMRITIQSSNGEEIVLQLHYKKGELTYQAVGNKKLSEYTFNKNFSDNEGKRSFSINSIGFDSSQGFYVDVNLQLTQEEFKVKGTTVINSGDSDEDSGDTPKEVKNKKYSVDVSIDGENMILKAANDGLKHEVSISFGLNELTSGNSTIGNYSFGYFYGGTEIMFYNQESKTIESENIGRRDISSSTDDLGDVSYQKITVTGIKDGSKVFLTTNTGLGNLAGAIANNGFKAGAGTVTNEITYESGSNVEYVKIEARMEKGKNWKEAKKTFYYKADMEDEYAEAKKGQKMLGGKYNGKGKVKISFWKGSIDFYGNTTPTIERNGLVKALLSVTGVILAFDAIAFPLFSIGNIAMLKQAASFLKDKKLESVTKGETISALVAGIAAAAIVAIAVAGIMGAVATAGTSIAVAIAIISAIMAAITTYMGSKAAFDASEGFQMYAKTKNSDYLKEGILNTFIFAISLISAYGIGSGISNFVTNFTLKAMQESMLTGVKYALIGASIGSVAGSGINILKNLINHKKWSEGMWEWMGIGALAGTFIGFNIGFKVGAAANTAAGGVANATANTAAGTANSSLTNFLKSGWLNFKKASVLAKIGNIVGMLFKTLDSFITVIMAKNLIECCKNGDIVGAISSFYVMFTINIMNPMISKANKAEKVENTKETSLLDTMKKTSGAYKIDNGNLVFSGTTLKRSIIMGAIGFGIGYAVGFLLKGDKKKSFIFAALGAMVFYGLSSAIAAGGYDDLKVSTFTDGLKNISLKTFEMTNRMLQFNLRLQYIFALIGLIRYAVVGKKLSEDNSWWGKFIKAVDNFLDFNLMESAESLIYGEGGNLAAFNIDGVSNGAIKVFSNVLSPSMLLFSAGVAFFMPILGPALLNSPILGTIAQWSNMLQEYIQDNLGSDFLVTFVEEGLKENIIGLLAGHVFGKSEFGQIFQELFDDFSYGNIDDDFLNSESAMLATKYGKTTTELEKEIKKASKSIEDLSIKDLPTREAIVNEIASKFNIERNKVSDLVDKKRDGKNAIDTINIELTTEIVTVHLISQKIISTEMAENFKILLNEVDLKGMSFVVLANYIYGLASVYASNTNSSAEEQPNKTSTGDIDFNALTEEQLKNTSTQGLLNLDSAYSLMDNNKGKLVLKVSEIIQNRVQGIVDAKDTESKVKAFVDGKFGKISSEVKRMSEEIENIEKNIKNNQQDGEREKEKLEQYKKDLENFISSNILYGYFFGVVNLLGKMVSNASVDGWIIGEKSQQYKQFEKNKDDFVKKVQSLATSISDIILSQKFEEMKNKLENNINLLTQEIGDPNNLARQNVLKAKLNAFISLQKLTELGTSTDFFKMLSLTDSAEMTIVNFFKMMSSLNNEKLKDYRRCASEYRKEASKYIDGRISSDFRLLNKLSSEEVIVLKTKYLSQISTMDNTSLLFSFDIDSMETSIKKESNLVEEQDINAVEKQIFKQIPNIIKKLESNNESNNELTEKEKEMLYLLGVLEENAIININKKIIINKLKSFNTISQIQEVGLIKKARDAIKSGDERDYKEYIENIKGMEKLRLYIIASLRTEKNFISKLKFTDNLAEQIKTLNKYYETKIEEVNKMSFENLMYEYFTTKSVTSDISQLKEIIILEKLKKQYDNFVGNKESDEYKNMQLFFGKDGVFDLLTSGKYNENVDVVVTENNNKALLKIKRFTENSKKLYWKKFDDVILETMRKKEITNGEKLRIEVNNGNRDIVLELRKGMIKVFGESKTDENLTFIERLAMDLKISEIASGVWKLDKNGQPEYIAYNKKNLEQAYEGDDLNNYGCGILGASSEYGTNIGNQILMLCECLLGRESALSAGGGKTFVYSWLVDIYFSLNSDPNQLNIAEILGAKATDSAQLSGKAGKPDDDVKFMWSMMLIETVNGDQQYQNGSEKNDYSELIGSYKNKISDGYRGRVITFSLDKRGFVELQARVGQNGSELNKVLNNVILRIVDEADVAALGRIAFILGTGDKTVDKLKAKYIVECLQELQKIEVNGKSIKANTKVTSKGKLADNEYCITDGKVICSDALEKILIKKFNNTGLLNNGIKGLLNSEIKSIDELPKYKNEVDISQVMRAMYEKQANADNMESVAFVNGQPVSIQAGTKSNNITDQSLTYNVALVALKIQELKRVAGATDKDISKMQFEDYKYGKGKGKDKYEYDVNNVKISVSSGESTISQIFSRNQVNTLNCGGSATVDIAREVAQVLFGGIAVNLEASSIKKIMSQYSDRFKVISFENEDAEEQIINEGVKSVKEFLTAEEKNWTKDANGDRVGLLVGAKKTYYSAEVMIRALAEISAETSGQQFTYEEIMESKKGETLTQILEYISDNYENMRKYTQQIQIIDADMAGNHSDEVAIMAKTKGKLTFSNESGLRGMNYKSINMIILDGHNFPISDLLQALGRVGRNIEWGRNKACITVYMNRNSINTIWEQIKKVDEYDRQYGKNVFENNKETSNSDLIFNEIIRGEANPNKITDIDYLEVVSTYKSMQLKSESILFKARQEVMYILVKEPLAEMAAKARDSGDIEGAKFLTDLYYKIISNDEGNLFEKDIDRLSDPEITIKQIFENVLKVAEAYLTLAQEYKFKDSGINIDFAKRLVDIKSMTTEVFEELKAKAEENKGYFYSTFARASREVNFSQNMSPTMDIAKVLIKLIQYVLPTATSKEDNTLTVVSVEEAIKTAHNITKEQKEMCKEILNTDENLSYVNNEGERVLTEKGKEFFYLVKQVLYLPRQEFIDYITNLLKVVDSDFNDNKVEIIRENKEGNKTQENEKLNILKDFVIKLNIKDSKAFEFLLDSYKMIDKTKIFKIETIQKIQKIININKYEQGLEKFAERSAGYPLPRVQTVWLAKLDLLSNKELEKTILDNYNKVKDAFDENCKSGIIRSQKLKGKLGCFFEGAKTGIPLLWFKLVNKIPLVKKGYWGYIGAIRKINKELNPELADILDKGKTKDEEVFVEETKSQMALAGIGIDENTDIAIKNMENSYSNLESKVVRLNFKNMSTISKILSVIALGIPFAVKAMRAKSDLRKKYFTLKDINVFADMKKLIKFLLDKNEIELSKQEKFMFDNLFKTKEQIKKEKEKLGISSKSKEETKQEPKEETKQDSNSNNHSEEETTEPGTIGRMNKLIKEWKDSRGKKEGDLDVINVFKRLYPQKNTDDLIKRYDCVNNYMKKDNDNDKYNVLGTMSIDEIADDNNFEIDGKENDDKKEMVGKIKTTKKFDKKYSESKQNITFSKLMEIKNSEFEKFKSGNNKKDGENNKMLQKGETAQNIETLKSGENKTTKPEKGKTAEQKEIKTTESNEDKNAEKDKEVKKIEEQLKVKFDKEFEQKLKIEGINYKKIKKNYDKIAAAKQETKQVLEQKEEAKVEEQKPSQILAETLTVEDLSNDDLAKQLIEAIKQGVITVGFSKDFVIFEIKNLTPEKIFECTGQTVEKFITDYQVLLEKMAGLNVNVMKKNQSYIKDWLSKSNVEVVDKFKEKIDFNLFIPWNMEELSSETFKKKILYTKTVKQVIREKLDKKPFSELNTVKGKNKKVVASLNIEDKNKFLKLIGLEQLYSYSNKTQRQELKDTLKIEKNQEIKPEEENKEYDNKGDGKEIGREQNNKKTNVQKNKEIDNRKIKVQKDKEIDKKVENIVDNIIIEDLNDTDYVTAVTDLLKTGFIEAEDIERKEKLKKKIWNKKYVDFVRALNSEDKADKVLKAIGLKNVIDSIKILRSVKGVSVKKVYDITIKNMTIKDLSDKKAISNIDLKQLDKKTKELIGNRDIKDEDMKDKKDEKMKDKENKEDKEDKENEKMKDKEIKYKDIEAMTSNEEEEGIIKTEILKGTMEQLKKQNKNLNAIKIAIMSAEVSHKNMEISTKEDAFVDKKVAGGENMKTEIRDLMSATGTNSAIITNDSAIKKGMMLVLEGENEDNTYVITVKKVQNNVVQYAINVNEKKDIITSSMAIENLKRGVVFTQNGNPAPMQEGKINNKFKWKGVVLATDKQINNINEGITTVKKIQDTFNIKKETAEKIGVEGMKTLIEIINGITKPKTDLEKIRAIAGILLKEKKDTSELTVQNIASVFGCSIETVNTMKYEDIVNLILTRMKDISEDKNNIFADKEMTIELTAVAGGLLLAMKTQNVDKVTKLEQNKINKNQATISELLKRVYKNNYANSNGSSIGKNGDDFIINLTQLREAVEQRQTHTKKDKITILDALANNDDQSMKENVKAIKEMFTSQIVKAVTASA